MQNVYIGDILKRVLSGTFLALFTLRASMSDPAFAFLNGV